VCDPSSGNTELCLTEITPSGSQIFFVCLVGAWQRNFEPAVCVHVPCTHTHTHTHTHKPRKISTQSEFIQLIHLWQWK